MSLKTVNNTPEISKLIKNRRLDLGLTIEAAASKAGVGTKTWCRYEAGESIRSDKVKGLCRALNWAVLPDGSVEYDDGFEISEYKNNKFWSNYISDVFGEVAAISFIIGSDILLDYINEDLQQLASMARGTHVGQLDFSMLADILPQQFLMEYDYDFIFRLKSVVCHLRGLAANNSQIIAHSVIEELALYLIVDCSEFLTMQI